MARLKYCAYIGCRELVPLGQAYCEKHAELAMKHEKERQRNADKRRVFDGKSASKRGYDRQWNRISQRWRAQHPFCEECRRMGRLTLAECVDHIIPHKGDASLLYDLNNLQSLCWKCHSRKTAREDGGFGNKPKEQT